MNTVGLEKKLGPFDHACCLVDLSYYRSRPVQSIKRVRLLETLLIFRQHDMSLVVALSYRDISPVSVACRFNGHRRISGSRHDRPFVR